MEENVAQLKFASWLFLPGQAGLAEGQSHTCGRTRSAPEDSQDCSVFPGEHGEIGRQCKHGARIVLTVSLTLSNEIKSLKGYISAGNCGHELKTERCAQGDIVTHTAWLNRSSILYAGEDKWSVDPRVSLVTLNQEEFTIKIENVDMTDEGQYVCAVQTSSRPRTTSVHVLVQVPPKIINLSRDIVVNEGSNVTLMCQASGKPEPSISWKLISSSGDLASDDEYLEIPSISRQRAGAYECTAVNDIDADVQTVDITVNYAPTVSEGRDVGVTLGQRGVLECEADAVPEADFEWYKDDRRIINGFNDMEIVNTGSMSKLTFFNVSDGDYGNYTCVAINKLGSSNTSFLLYGPRAVQDGSGGAMGLHSHTCLLFIVFLPFLLRF
ncbi:Opioid-binding protein/cell adhesion molecule -like protein [Channa argus]|uniref:Opioid-binding protein/cell adhesion molecule-like protein n=1 Tax=Channa argus TaxID=215402 RepID=A0A6G1QWC4_CHAAH|nr:Opioid-binding protein/cell adhesion molecule -like protein [Channa argus]